MGLSGRAISGPNDSHPASHKLTGHPLVEPLEGRLEFESAFGRPLFTFQHISSSAFQLLPHDF